MVFEDRTMSMDLAVSLGGASFTATAKEKAS
jgi:hypothetical protein